MNRTKKLCSLTTAFLMAVSAAAPVAVNAEGADKAKSYDMNVKVNLADKGIEISPYIFGINEHGLDDSLQVNSVRQGGNRFTAYNWETNYSSAGSDWKHSSDDYLSTSKQPADCIQTLSKEAKKGNIAYKLGTVQMAGYVAADKKGTVEETEAAPSDRWNKVVAAKGSEFSLEPDLTDGTVYMDEYINYVVNKLGDSSSATGIQGWSLDNEPGLWHHTHPRIHTDEVTCEELIQKSIETAQAVKSVDPKAEIFGPALFGYTAYRKLSASDSEEDWKNTNKDGEYNWFISYYLDQMKKAEEKTGQRLLDVMDVHYYSEAKGPECDVRMCSNPEHTKCIDEMLQSYRTLIEKDYKENSWIGEWCQENIPLLTTMKESIDKYYPGTKLGITEYDFGGGKTIAGAIAEVDALGTFAKNEVYYATLWAEDVPYQYSAINLFTNYDGNGSAFGNTLIESETDDYIKSTSYAAVNNGKQDEVTVIVTNKSQTETENAIIDLSSAKTEYKNAAVYILSGETNEIIHKVSFDSIKDNKLTVEIPPLAIAEVYVSDDEDDYRPVVEKVLPTYEYVEGTVTKGKKGGDYTVKFDEELDGNKLVLDIALEGSQSASGCIDFSGVKLDGDDYWVHYNWAVTSSQKAEIDLMKPTGAMNITKADDVDITDEEVLAQLAELIKTSKTVSFQTWYVADSNWDDSDHSKVTLKGASIKKASGNAAPSVSEFEGKVTADKTAGNYTMVFDEKVGNGKLVLDIETDDTPLANGCVDTNVTYKGTPYWVFYGWEAKASGKVEVDITKLKGAMDTSKEDSETIDDEELLAELAKLVGEQSKLTFQTWYVADKDWDDADHAKVTLKSAVLVKESSEETPSTPVTPSKKMRCDFDGNGVADMTDLVQLSLYLLGDIDFNDEMLELADADGNGKVNIADLAHFKQYVSHVEGIKLAELK